MLYLAGDPTSAQLLRAAADRHDIPGQYFLNNARRDTQPYGAWLLASAAAGFVG